MEARPDFGRLVTTLGHEEPDRVPLVEAAVDYAIMSQFLGYPVADDDVASQVEFWSNAGYDYIPLTLGMMRPGGVTRDSQISKVIEDTIVKDEAEVDDQEAWNLEKRSRIHTEADFEAFPWDEAAKIEYSKLYEVQAYLPPGMKIILMSGKIFTLTWMLMGFENLAINLMVNAQFARRVMEKVAVIQLEAVKRAVSVPNVGAVWAVDDIAFGSGTMLRPEFFREYLFPWYEECARLCHEKGLFFFFHSDGVLWDLIPDLIDLGVDALHPIDPTCMDIEQVKRRVGDELCIMGNIPNDLLMTGTPDEVVELTKTRLKALAPGGGYCLGSGNSVPDWAKIVNYRAMIETGLRYGRYPIDIT